MPRHLLIGLWGALFLSVWPTISSAQNLGLRAFEARLIPEEELIPEEDVRVDLKSRPKEPAWFVTARYLTSETYDAPGLQLGYIHRGGVPFVVSAAATRIDPEGSTGALERYDLSTTVRLSRKDSAITVTGLAAFSDTDRSYSELKGGLATELKLGQVFSVGGSVGWAERDYRGAGAVEDFIPTFEMTAGSGVLDLSVSYTLDNDVDGEDDYGLAASVKPSPDSRFTGYLMLAKDNRVSVGLRAYF